MNRRLFCYYGDDFTGSTDALEALAANGVPSVLFVDPPGAAELARFPDCQAIGLAGESRSRSPEWMSEHLPLIFQSLRAIGAPLCQYKVCSTFDSSSQCGSIGRAIEIGRAAFDSPYVPVVVAAPHLQRFVAFGNLFAFGSGAIHRIDRHPTMSRHPVTPMHEADLRLHLAGQTSARIALLELPSLLNGHAARALDKLLESSPDAVLFDGLNEVSLLETGRLLWDHRVRPSFAVGSSGLTHALIHQWRDAGVLTDSPSRCLPPPVDRMIVVSGSCSPVTEAQIRRGMAAGFSGFRVNPHSLDDNTLLRAARGELDQGKSVILYTALGHADRLEGAGGDALGKRLGRLLRDLLLESGVRRAVVAGGDTSTHAVRQLGIAALTFAGLTVPGAPLCRASSPAAGVDGLELVLKGGQIGPEEYFERVRKGSQT